MKVTKTEFVHSAYSPKDFPKDHFVQIAFAGRSNVGKSSMINCLLQKKNLARISSQPGKTRSINFHKINDRFYFVDLPGYGYAKVSKTEREKWRWLIEAYLIDNENLSGLIQIIDARIGITEKDEEMIAFALDVGVEPLIVATKIDKLNQREKMKNLKRITDILKPFTLHGFIPFSSKTYLGNREVWRWIEIRLTKHRT
jgi:GTP-binding protein